MKLHQCLLSISSYNHAHNIISSAPSKILEIVRYHRQPLESRVKIFKWSQSRRPSSFNLSMVMRSFHQKCYKLQHSRVQLQIKRYKIINRSQEGVCSLLNSAKFLNSASILAELRKFDSSVLRLKTNECYSCASQSLQSLHYT